LLSQEKGSWSLAFSHEICADLSQPDEEFQVTDVEALRDLDKIYSSDVLVRTFEITRRHKPDDDGLTFQPHHAMIKSHSVLFTQIPAAIRVSAACTRLRLDFVELHLTVKVFRDGRKQCGSNRRNGVQTDILLFRDFQ
jgi:hypothetical protein